MKGIILAGGKGTRLHPLTRHTNKHLLPVGPEPMIYNPVRNMVACGVREILVVTSSRHMGDIVTSLGSGEEFGADFTYKVQEEARGIADALRLGRRFAGEESVFVLLGDNIFDTPLAHFTANYREQQKERGARVMLVKVNDPTGFGVAALDETKVVEIQEKPEKPKSNYAVVGAYLYDSQVWEIIESLSPSKRGEYEITDVNNAYIARGELSYDFVRGMWMDTGTFESYHRANEILFSRRSSSQ
jgi:glucose-1-phosphate thymidylyltransferase